MSELFTIEALTPQGAQKYAWKADLLEQQDGLIVLYGHWLRLLRHADGHETPITNQSLEFYWPDKLYTISALYDEAGKLREYYGRIILPPHIDHAIRRIAMTLIGPDLEITPDFKYEVLDLPDRPTPDQEEQFDLAQGWLDLVSLVERREGPFDAQFIKPFYEKIKR